MSYDRQGWFFTVFRHIFLVYGPIFKIQSSKQVRIASEKLQDNNNCLNFSTYASKFIDNLRQNNFWQEYGFLLKKNNNVFSKKSTYWVILTHGIPSKFQLSPMANQQMDQQIRRRHMLFIYILGKIVLNITLYLFYLYLFIIP